MCVDWVRIGSPANKDVVEEVSSAAIVAAMNQLDYPHVVVRGKH